MSKAGSPPMAAHDFIKANGLGPKDTATYNDEPSMTRQEFAEECDINTIMAKYDSYLSDPMRSIREPMYLDLTAMPSTLMESMEILNRARDAFYALPAVVRREFDNDPVLFADFAADPENVGQMREWGLAAPEKAPDAPMKVEVVNPAPPPPDEAPPEPPAAKK